jgi:hypothetical protein
VSALRFAADENLNERLLLALARRFPGLDVVRIRETRVVGGSDEEVLAWAAAEDRVLLTHDARTMPPRAWNRVAAGRAMPGLVVIPWNAPSGRVVEELSLLVAAGLPADLCDTVLFLPGPAGA